ncbi:hypothetical protein [Rufibacter roseus]|uniref:Uncharacterized protein n=1 Tax=Rufibacter roseus TaxID=1567108 RepID=A0ABW2DNX4_9BACT|nr:hypothetical protein [Rufibacter roseus]
MKNLFTKNPFTTIGGVVVITIASVDMYRNGVHGENIGLMATGLALLKAADSGKEAKIETHEG